MSRPSHFHALRLAAARAISIAAFFGAINHARAWGANDVSMLLPLPLWSERDLLLRGEDHDSRGPLLPREVFDKIPALVQQVKPNVLYREDVRVVAIRLDPCFIEGTPPAKCRKQIRLSWQPVQNAGRVTTTLDAALHTFYEFDDASWASLFSDWATLRRGAPTDDLDIHPVLKAEGYSGPYWKTVREILLRHCGSENLVRAAVMTLHGRLLWAFSSFDVRLKANGQIELVRNVIPRLPPGRLVQSFVMDFESILNLEEFGARVSPPIADETWIDFAKDSAEFKRSKPETEWKQVVGRALEFENPGRHNAGTLDCVSCHAAQTTRLWGEKNGSAWDWSEFTGVRFSSARNLKNNSVRPFQTNRLRSFGYFEDEPLISQRVVNETALVLDQLGDPSPNPN